MEDTKKGITQSGSVLHLLESFGFVIVYKSRYINPFYGERLHCKEYLLTLPMLGALVHVDCISGKLETANLYLETKEDAYIELIEMFYQNVSPNENGTFLLSVDIAEDMGKKLELIFEQAKANPIWTQKPDFVRIEMLNSREELVYMSIEYERCSRVKFQTVISSNYMQRIFGKCWKQ